ncbi:hypothetical protein HY440_03190, partial [Candidatus Microgenomates bacterium]|nr:hypothetical protein [Candidatus Microgenomates bacterium]
MLSHEAISGAPAEGVYSQALTLGDFFIVLSLEGSGVNLELGRNTLAKIEEILTQTPGISPAELVEMQKEEFTNGITLNLLIAKVIEQKLSLSGVGQVTAKLVRQGKTVKLFPGPAVSGDLLHNDALTLGTNQYFINPSPEDSRVAALEIKVNLENSAELSAIRSPLSAPRHVPSLFLRRPHDPNAPTPVARKALYLAIIVFVFLLSLIVWQLRSRVLEQRQKAAATITARVQDGMSAAQKLTGVSDAMARNILLQTRSDFKSSADQTFGADWPPQLKSLLADLDKQISTVSHVY